MRLKRICAETKKNWKIHLNNKLKHFGNYFRCSQAKFKLMVVVREIFAMQTLPLFSISSATNLTGAKLVMSQSVQEAIDYSACHLNCFSCAPM